MSLDKSCLEQEANMLKFFWKNLSRTQAEKLLMEKSVCNGTYLLRLKSKPTVSNMFVLSAKFCSVDPHIQPSVWHFDIKSHLEEGTFSHEIVEGKRYSSLLDLINSYKQRTLTGKNMPLALKLSSPFVKKSQSLGNMRYEGETDNKLVKSLENLTEKGEYNELVDSPTPVYTPLISQKPSEPAVKDHCECGLELAMSKLLDGWTVHKSRRSESHGLLYYKDMQGNTTWIKPLDVFERLNPAISKALQEIDSLAVENLRKAVTGGDVKLSQFT